jgi:nucleotide-binding universal stress UspA family protein
MLKKINKLLFATNLSENCLAALHTSVAMATTYQATLVLLFVMHREVPGHVESDLKYFLGEEKWNELIQEHEKETHDALIGKMSSKKINRTVMRKYCEESGIDPDSCSFPYEEVVAHGEDVPGTIASQAETSECGAIVLGAKKGFVTTNSVGSVIKGVLRKSKVPVIVVPPYT